MSQPPTQAATAPQKTDRRRGRIDIHSHLLPGIDDGCVTLDETLAAVRLLLEAGFCGSICTPHIWPERFPQNTPQHVAAWTRRLQSQVREAGLDYDLWPGGELRLSEGAVAWMGEHGVPTLAASRCVLTDHWEDSWPDWIDGTLAWLLQEGYQPILAHPERVPPSETLDARLRKLADMGVWMQGNLRSMTGEDGYHADRRVRELLKEQRYAFMAMDVHGPLCLPGRLDGIKFIEEEFGRDLVDRLTIDAPRESILQNAEAK